MRAGPLVSCLCVTERRPAFIPWLLWCFDRQRWPWKELVIVDSSTTPVRAPDRTDVRVVDAPPGTSVPQKRNLALTAARGEVLAWFDDDDWQHPERLAHLVTLLAATKNAVCAGPRVAWAVDVFREEAWRFPELNQGVLFNGSAFTADFARRFSFDPRRSRASDTAWMAELLAGAPCAPLISGPNFFWLFHERNLSLSPRTRSRAAAVFEGPVPVGEARASLGGEAWADTDEQLGALRARLAEETSALRGRS